MTYLATKETIDKQKKFRAILETYGLSQIKSAELLEELTSRPCSARTVRSWLTDPENKSARPCPQWAIDMLEKNIQ